MILQYLKNAEEDGANRDGIYEYLKDVLPKNKMEEQKLRSLGDLLKGMFWARYFHVGEKVFSHCVTSKIGRHTKTSAVFMCFDLPML